MTIKSRALSVLFSDAARSLGHAAGRLQFGTKLRFFAGVDDPYSYLMAQVIDEFAAFVGRDYEIHWVSPPTREADARPDLRRAWAVRDARELSEQHGLEFPAGATDFSGVDSAMRLASQAPTPTPAQVRDVLRVSFGPAPAATNTPTERGSLPGDTLLKKLRHYQGGMIHCEGAWYWGLDRMGHLEADTTDADIIRRWPTILSDAKPLPLEGDVEVFFSFRSPYSYLALARLDELASRPEVASVRLRPVLPMVMRGVPAPLDKRLYLAFDAAREARRIGVPYGNLADPLGEGVERCIAMFAALSDEEARQRFAVTAIRAIWAGGVDTATDRGIQRIADEAKVAHAVEPARTVDWRSMASENQAALTEELGLWGVPCFRASNRVVWGQDRVW